MKVQVRSTDRGDINFSDSGLVVIEPDDNTTISISPTCLEVETYDNDGNRLTQRYIEVRDLGLLLR